MTDTSKKKARVWRPGSKPKHVPEPVQERTESDGLALRDVSTDDVRDFMDDVVAKAKAKDKEGLRDVAKEMFKVARRKLRDQLDADRILQMATGALIEAAGARYAVDAGDRWAPGKPLKILLAGYSGTRNTGADVRVEEMIRQFRHLFGDDHVDMSIYSINPELTRGYFRTVKQIYLPKVFPKTLFDTIHEQHMVVTCEGSMFKSKFANALSTMMVGSLGMALAEQKLAVGYGGEAGKMDRSLRDMVTKYCEHALIIARNENSQHILRKLGVASRAGTDTAWPFEPSPPEVGREILMSHGWDGETPILALCPINPFWWPVKPNVPAAAMNALTGMYDDVHYGSVYFHAAGSEIDDKQDAYLQAMADATARIMKEHAIFPVMFGSEQLDRIAGEKLMDKIEALTGRTFPVVVSDEYDMFDMVSAMRNSTYMVSSRYHAIVTTMAGGVVSAGITMDERIRNLMKDRGSPHLALEVDDPDLGENLFETLKILVRDADEIRVGIDDCVYRNLERMGEMGAILVDHVRAEHPEFPFREELGEAGDPWDHLPSFDDNVKALCARVEARREKNAQGAGAVSESPPEARA